MISLCIGMLFAACSGKPLEQTEPAVSAAESTEASFSWESPVESETDQQLPNMLYARDKLFVSTGRKAILTCGTADGNITSVTAPKPGALRKRTGQFRQRRRGLRFRSRTCNGCGNRWNLHSFPDAGMDRISGTIFQQGGIVTGYPHMAG